MEINTQQLDALLHVQEQQAQLTRPNTPAPGFDALLNQQLLENANGDPRLVTPGSGDAAIIGDMLLGGVDSANAVDPDTAVLQAAFQEASGALDLWDTYAQALGRSSSDTALKDAYAILQGIDSRISQLKANPLAGNNAAFDGVLNELEILATTEKFKFNRGDYLG